MKARVIVSSVVLVLAFVALAFWQRTGARQQPRVGEDHGREIVATIPIASGVAFESYLLRVAASVRSPLGLERVQDQRNSSRLRQVPPRQPEQTMLTGRSFSDAIDQLILHAPNRDNGSPSFERHLENGVTHVSAFRGRATFLDQRVPSFRASGRSVVEILYAVHRLFDATFPENGPESGSVGGDGEERAKELALAQTVRHKPISVDVVDVTVRQILDAAVVSNGGGSWIVRYRDSSGAYAGCQLAFATFDGNVTSTVEARPTK